MGLCLLKRALNRRAGLLVMFSLLEFVEIDIPYCANTYGDSPCTANGSDKCYNTRNIFSDCQDTANFDKEFLTLRFAKPSSDIPPEIDCIQNIKSIQVTSPRINPAENIGERFSAQITFRNHPHGDTGLDKYISDRNYIPYDQGTFWGKFRARNPYIKSANIRIIRGEAGQSLSEMETFHLKVDNFAGPNASGSFSISAVDMFQLIHDEESQAPNISNGYLAAAITDSDTTCALSPAGVLSEYPASGKVRIGKEVCSYTKSGAALSLVRAQSNTKAEEHDAEEAVQLVLEYASQSPEVIVHDLLTNYSEMDADALDLGEWASEVENYPVILLSREITRPTPVKTLLNEIIQQVGLVFWCDVKRNKVSLRILRPVSLLAKQVNDDIIMQKTLSMKDQQKKRVSTAWTFFNTKDPTESVTKSDNYYSQQATLGQESDQYETAAIRTTYASWLPFFSRSVVSQINARVLSLYEIPPRLFSFSLFHGEKIEMGQGINLSSRHLEKADGSIDAVPVQVVSVVDEGSSLRVIAQEMRFSEQPDFNIRRVIIDFDSVDLNLRDIYNTIYSGVSASDEVEFVVESGIVVGSDANEYAIDVGDWPVGATIRLVNKGRIQGKGGRGGVPSPVSSSSQDGLDGAHGLLVDFPIELNNQNGQIYGSGGGGGGAKGGWLDNGMYGGAGAGCPPGTGRTVIQPPADTYLGQDRLYYIGDDNSATYGYTGAGGDISQDGEDAATNNTTDDSVVITGAHGDGGHAIVGEFNITYLGAEGDIQGTRIGPV